MLGCLIEKQRTTPDGYPLSVNALRLACNQSTGPRPGGRLRRPHGAGRAGAAGPAALDAAGQRRRQQGAQVPPAAGPRAARLRARAGRAVRADAARPPDPGRAQAAHRAPAPVRRPGRDRGHPAGADRPRAGARRWSAARARRSSATSSCWAGATRRPAPAAGRRRAGARARSPTASGASRPRWPRCAASSTRSRRSWASDRAHPLRRSEEDRKTQSAGALELFYDLVFVFAITQVSHHLLEHLTWEGAGQSALMLLMVWWSWNYTTWLTNELNADTVAGPAGRDRADAGQPAHGHRDPRGVRRQGAAVRRRLRGDPGRPQRLPDLRGRARGHRSSACGPAGS